MKRKEPADQVKEPETKRIKVVQPVDLNHEARVARAFSEPVRILCRPKSAPAAAAAASGLEDPVPPPPVEMKTHWLGLCQISPRFLAIKEERDQQPQEAEVVATDTIDLQNWSVEVVSVMVQYAEERTVLSNLSRMLGPDSFRELLQLLHCYEVHRLKEYVGEILPLRHYEQDWMELAEFAETVRCASLATRLAEKLRLQPVWIPQAVEALKHGTGSGAKGRFLARLLESSMPDKKTVSAAVFAEGWTQDLIQAVMDKRRQCSQPNDELWLKCHMHESAGPYGSIRAILSALGMRPYGSGDDTACMYQWQMMLPKMEPQCSCCEVEKRH